MEKKKKKISVIRIIIFVIAGAVFVFSAYKLFTYFYDNKKSEDKLEKLINMAVTVYDTAHTPDSSSAVSSVSDTKIGSVITEESTAVYNSSPDPDVIPLSVNFDILHNENPDIIAWIYCAGTPINFPVLQGEDNDYYLQRLTDGSPNPSGSIFMDFRNNSDFSDMNTIIYGHNMSSGTMFSSLVNYIYKDYYEKHQFLWIITKDQAYRLDVMAGFVTSSDSYAYTVFNDEESFDSYLQSISNVSNFKSDVSPDGVTNIVTLSTCTNREDSERYVVIGKLVPVE